MLLKVLVVDDEPILAETIAELLRWDGHDVTVAATGDAAVEAIAAGLPDLLIIDYMMPRLDGIATIHLLRAKTETAALPIVLMSAVTPSLDAGGAWDALLRKPFELDGLHDVMKRALTRRSATSP